MAYHIHITNEFNNLFVQGDSSKWFNGNLFQQELLLITQNQQIKHWLVNTATEVFGIAPFLEEHCQLSDQAIRQLLPKMAGIEEQFNFSKEFDKSKRQILFTPDLRLIIYKYLEKKIAEEDPLFAPVIAYLRAQEEQKTTLQSSRLFALASSVATLMEQYSARYDPLMEAWQANTLHKGDVEEQNNFFSATQQWQQRLWYDLFGDPHQARYALPSDVVRAVLKAESGYTGSLKRIIIVGTPFLHPLHHRFFIHLAKHLEVHFIVYSAVALKTQENVALMSAFDRQYMGALEEYYLQLKTDELEYQEHFEDKKGTHALVRVQQAIAFHEKVTQEDLPRDDSMRVIACSDPLREVEVLRDSLLHALNDDPQLQLHDICVVMSDPALYTPYLSKVFLDKGQGNVDLPIHFDDLLASASLSPSYQLILDLLGLTATRLSRSQILELLQNELLMARLDVTQDDLAIWQAYTENYHIAWGFDQEHKAQEVAGASDNFTWLAAFRRYLDDYLWDTKENLQEVHAPSIGKLIYVVHQLYEDFHTVAQERLSLEEWVDYLEPKLARFLPDTQARNGQINLFRSLNEIGSALNQLKDDKFVDNKIPFVVVMQLIKESMEREVERTLHQSSAQGILCAPIAALRLIPFKLVAFLGMNEERYPSQESANSAGYNLSELFKKTFIMSRSNNERASFLETFLSAKERVLFFYQASDRQSGQTLEPSSVIFDLFRQVELPLSFDHEKGYPLLQSMPLYPFHASLFHTADPKQQTFSQQASDLAQAYYAEKKEDIIEPQMPIFASQPLHYPEKMRLTDLVDFIWQPLESAMDYHLEQGYQAPEIDGDKEQYHLSSKVRKLLFSRLLERIITEESPASTLVETIWQEALAEGEIIKSVYLESYYEEFRQLAELAVPKIREKSQGRALSAKLPQQKYAITLEAEDSPRTWSFTLKDCYENQAEETFYRYILSSYVQNKEKICNVGYDWSYRIEEKLINTLWHLAGMPDKLEVILGLFIRPENEAIKFCLNPPSEQDTPPKAQEPLDLATFRRLVELYKENLASPLVMSSGIWVGLMEKSYKDDAELIKNYKTILEKKMTDEFHPEQKLVDRLAYLGVDVEAFAKRDLSEKEQEMLTFLWNNFFQQ
ncbi:exodeoxyribonuclease V subunit gamma [Entomospira culicis]|nr:exodeoxyribonuclease V subunit gamma [Entomospira culicis]WDI36813.1 exodeoxyribonuclease V subunit gamma [Entomospira culicis]